MLTIEALNATKTLVAILADKGVTLRAVGGSPLAEAQSATKIWGSSLDDLSAIDTLPESLYQSNEPTIVNGEVRDDVHSTYQDVAAQSLGVALAAHIAHATTVVLPLISELHDEIKNKQNLEARCGVRSYNVQMVTGSPLLDVAEIVSSIDSFSSIDPRRDLPFVLDFKSLGDEDLVKQMKIGAETFDAAVDAFVAQNGIALIREVWSVVFARDPSDYKTYDQFRADRDKGLARNFAVFLFTSKMLSDLSALPEVTGLGLLSSGKYGMELKSLQEAAGAALAVQLNFQRNNEKVGKLIDKIDGKTVFVNKTVYDRFMAEGGDIETILGAVVSGDKKIYVNEIGENVEKYKQSWTYHVTQAKQNAASSELIDVRMTIDGFVRLYLTKTTDGVLITNRERILDNLKTFLERTFAPALKEIDVLAMKVICDVVFNHTDAGKILQGVNEAMAANTDITKEDALNMSVTNYVADWFASQIEIEQ